MALIAGSTAKDSIEALSESLAGVVGFAAGSHEVSQQMLTDLAVDMHKTILKNWAGIIEARRRAERSASAPGPKDA